MKFDVLSKEDKILVYINKDTDVQATRDIWKNMQRNFPNNQVIVIHNAFIDNIKVIHTDDPYNKILNVYNQCLVNEDYL